MINQTKCPLAPSDNDLVNSYINKTLKPWLDENFNLIFKEYGKLSQVQNFANFKKMEDYENCKNKLKEMAKELVEIKQKFKDYQELCDKEICDLENKYATSMQNILDIHS
jgi:hypothetical protein